jgi:hypothetical protein
MKGWLSLPSLHIHACPPAEHIQKQLERGYAVKDAASQAFAPTPLGESLISAYRRMGLDNLWKPDLRGRIEQGISRIAAGQVGAEQGWCWALLRTTPCSEVCLQLQLTGP